MKKVIKKNCPLCQSSNSFLYASGEARTYIHCRCCDLVYVPMKYFISKEAEKEKYDNHQNSPQNQGYIDFLNKLLIPLRKNLLPNAIGLDFGSGPGPTLSVIMQELGYEMKIYDYFYHDDKKVFEKSYDFITITEVIEHLHNPIGEIKKLWNCLNPGGSLGIMTAFRPDLEIFKSWYYKRDLTHVRFFTKETFQWLSNELNAELFIPQSGVVILKKEKI